MAASYPDGVVLATSNDPPGSCSQHRYGLLVGTLHRARELAADHVLAAVTGGGGHAAPTRHACRTRIHGFPLKGALWCFSAEAPFVGLLGSKL